MGSLSTVINKWNLYERLFLLNSNFITASWTDDSIVSLCYFLFLQRFSICSDRSFFLLSLEFLFLSLVRTCFPLLSYLFWLISTSIGPTWFCFCWRKEWNGHLFISLPFFFLSFIVRYLHINLLFSWFFVMIGCVTSLTTFSSSSYV